MTSLTLLTDHTKHLLTGVSLTKYHLVNLNSALALVKESFRPLRNEPSLCLKTFGLVNWYNRNTGLFIYAPGLLREDIASFPGINEYLYRKRNSDPKMQITAFENRPIWPAGELPFGLVFVKSDLPQYPGGSRLMVGLTYSPRVAPVSISSVNRRDR